MNKIENEMLYRIKSKKSGNFGSNMGVFIETAGNPYGTRAEVYLHGNLIAEWWYKDGVLHCEDCDVDSRHGCLYVNRQMLADYPTNLTISRLRALGADITVKRGSVYLNGNLVAER